MKIVRIQDEPETKYGIDKYGNILCIDGKD